MFSFDEDLSKFLTSPVSCSKTCVLQKNLPIGSRKTSCNLSKFGWIVTCLQEACFYCYWRKSLLASSFNRTMWLGCHFITFSRSSIYLLSNTFTAVSSSRTTHRSRTTTRRNILRIAFRRHQAAAKKGAIRSPSARGVHIMWRPAWHFPPSLTWANVVASVTPAIIVF